MTTHVRDPRVQEPTCGTLMNVAVNIENKTILVRERFLPLRDSARSQFPDDCALYKSAVVLLVYCLDAMMRSSCVGLYCSVSILDMNRTLCLFFLSYVRPLRRW